ncbi:Lysine-specific histone demethylase 1A [Gracilariopsis chorda]|uniref:Lysine-specific histone demethylase 1A n=1 Tax=Gracilariopsis chorda TaxID=448386 RepID=A0A2V3IYS3_9FLOR|nr:Lysine-specific histone demethylase 1A [Gracilariopsis chorda]|eukprot:PXF47302.1 Lysine-specific histone demethylase 1A [Gracilariopsis chorda]
MSPVASPTVPTSAPVAPVADPPPPRVIIVGAGVAGLACAQELATASPKLDVIVLEARNRVGGRVFTHWLNCDERIPPPPDSPSPTAASNPTETDDASAPPDSSDPAAQGNTLHAQWAPNIHLNHDGTLSSVFPTTSSPTTAQFNEHLASNTPYRHAFLDLVNGVVSADRFSHAGSPRVSVDIGASILHGCADENQLVFKRAIQSRIRAPIVAGGGFYESTEHALWFDQNTSRRIPTEIIVEMHNIFFMASRYMAAVASQSDDGCANMQTVFDCGLDYVMQHLNNRTLTPTELAVLKKICARSIGYCSPMSVMALMQASAGMETTSVNSHIGIPYEEDDPPFPGEIPSMLPASIKSQTGRYHKTLVATQQVPTNMIASKKGGPGDRIVLDGYTPFLIDRLKQGVNIRLNQSVCGVSKAVKPQLDPPMSLAEQHSSVPSNKPAKRARSHALYGWDTDPEVAQRTIFVSTRSGEVYQGDFVVIALPLGVLQSDHEESSVSFSPSLSDEKLDAIRGMGMGVHNKLIIRFREEDIFWPPKVPQLNCLDPRFQFFNMHVYGKTGVILVQVFCESGFAQGYWGLSDEGVLAEALMVLGGMFCSSSENGTVDSSTNATEAGIQSAANSATAKRRIARLLNICENCRRPLDVNPSNADAPGEDPVACQACGFVVQKDDLQQGSDMRLDPMSTQREKNDMEEGKAAPSDEPIISDDGIEPSPKRLTWQNFPAPVEYIVTRWDSDPFALGSYSFMPCGSDWNMIDQVCAPEPIGSPRPYLFFAGEHCSDIGWQCVHGAYETGIRSAKQIMACIRGESLDESVQMGVNQHVSGTDAQHVRIGGATDSFWTPEREKALTRALIGYSDVYGNFGDVIDEISYALQSFKKEPTLLSRDEIRELVMQRITERVEEHEPEATAFMRFHRDEERHHAEIFPKSFHEVHTRPRLVGLNGLKLKERYAEDIIRELRSYAKPVFENQISYRETLRKIALMIYKKDGGLMTKRCLSEYLRTQEFGTGPQKELFLAKYLPEMRGKQ